MKRISILVPQGAILGSVEGPYKLFSEANAYLERAGKGPAFQVKLVGLKKETPVGEGLFTVRSDITLPGSFTTDLIIVPAVHGDMKEALTQNEGFYSWITAQYKAGAEVASLCVGAFLLASTGLLKGKQCATHWIAANDFRKLFPDVRLVDEKIVTDEHGIYSSGGAYSYLNLILYLIEKYAGRATAIFCAKLFAIEIDRESQSPFIIFHAQKDHDDEQIKQAQIYIEQNYREKITVDELAKRFALGRRNLERRFKKATANTIVEYMQRVKVEAAKSSLESSRENVTEVMFNVGYTDPKAFRTVFKNITGLSPNQYRLKFNRVG